MKRATQRLIWFPFLVCYS